MKCCFVCKSIDRADAMIVPCVCPDNDNDNQNIDYNHYNHSYNNKRYAHSFCFNNMIKLKVIDLKAYLKQLKESRLEKQQQIFKHNREMRRGYNAQNQFFQFHEKNNTKQKTIKAIKETEEEIKRVKIECERCKTKYKRIIRPELEHTALNLWVLQTIILFHVLILLLGFGFLAMSMYSMTSNNSNSHSNSHSNSDSNFDLQSDYSYKHFNNSYIDILIFFVISSIISIVLFFGLKISLPEQSLDDQRTIVHAHDLAQQFVFFLIVQFDYCPNIFSSTLLMWITFTCLNKVVQQAFLFLVHLRIKSLFQQNPIKSIVVSY